MYECMYILYVCMYVCMHVYIYVSMFVSIYMCMYVAVHSCMVFGSADLTYLPVVGRVSYWAAGGQEGVVRRHQGRLPQPTAAGIAPRWVVVGS